MDDGLDAIEAQLRAREMGTIPTASEIVALKPRVLSAMRSARMRKVVTPLWIFAAGAAAAVVLAANVTVASMQTQPLVRERSRDTVALAKELHELLPELDARELARQTLLLEAQRRTTRLDFTRLRGGGNFGPSGGQGEIDP